MSMLIQKKWTKNWHIPPLCTDKNYHLTKSCFPEFNDLKKTIKQIQLILALKTLNLKPKKKKIQRKFQTYEKIYNSIKQNSAKKNQIESKTKPTYVIL